MWRPEFQFRAARPARLEGYHRRLSVFSHHYRGTPECPGLVLGLDEGGFCEGLLYDIEDDLWPQVIAQVRAREMLGDVYVEMILPVQLLQASERYDAITYVAHRHSEQFAPRMAQDALLAYISQGRGTKGSCRQYVANTILHLRQLGIRDEGLEVLAPHVL
jgi:glutathione-specific gamma-glutamylcyclotransferase